MVYHNRGDSDFRPSGDRGMNGVWFLPEEPAPSLEEGLYFRGRKFVDLQNDLEHCASGALPWGHLPLDAYQAWNEEGWKAKHRTIAACRRFAQKSIEERIEVDDALEEYLYTKDPTHLIEESGDFLYVSTAQTNLAGGVVSDALATRLFEYGKGTRQFENGRVSHPKWYDAVMEVAIKRGPVTVGDIDRLFFTGFAPTFTPAINRFDDESESATGYVFDFQLAYGPRLRQLTEIQFDNPEKEEEPSMRDPRPVFWNLEIADEAGKMAAEIYLRTAAIAHFAGHTLADVIATNYQKISGRIETRTVDHTDGARAVQ